MIKHITGADRSQIPLLLASLKKTIAQDNQVRLINLFVNISDLQHYGFKLKTDADGRPPYYPGQLLKLYLYGYLNKIRSSRDLEKECLRNTEFVWLLCKLAPDHNTIASFRKNNAKDIKKVF